MPNLWDGCEQINNLVDYPWPPPNFRVMQNFHRSSFVIGIGILVVAFAVPTQAAVKRTTVTTPPPTTTTNTAKTFVSPK